MEWPANTSTGKGQVFHFVQATRIFRRNRKPQTSACTASHRMPAWLPRAIEEGDGFRSHQQIHCGGHALETTK